MYAEVAVRVEDAPPLGAALLDDLSAAARDEGYRAERCVEDRFRHPRSLYGEARVEALELYCSAWSWNPFAQYLHDPDARIPVASKAPVEDEIAVEVRADRYAEAVEALADIGLDVMDDTGKRL